MTEKIPEEDKNLYAKRRVPLKRYGEPEEVAHATLNFCLPSSSFINGTVLPVDGGLTIKSLRRVLRKAKKILKVRRYF